MSTAFTVLAYVVAAWVGLSILGGLIVLPFILRAWRRDR